MKSMMTVLLIAVLCLVGCSQSQVITSLQLVVDAAEVAFPIIAQQANLSPALITHVDGYLQSVNVAITQAAPILASAEPPAQKVAQITAIFSKIATPNLPPGTPQAVANAVTAVANAVAQFLTNVGQAPKAIAAGKTKTLTLSKADVATLSKIEEKAKANLVKLKK